MSTVWEDTDVCSNQYRYALFIYLMNILSSLYGIMTDSEFNAPAYGYNVVDGLNSTLKRYLKG